MQLFPSLVFNRSGIILQPVDMPFQGVVLLLQNLHLLGQSLRILLLLLVSRQAILPKHNMIPNTQSQCTCGNCRKAATLLVNLMQPKAYTCQFFGCLANLFVSTHLML